MRHHPALLLLAFAGTFATAPCQENGELGRMWTFENPPLAYLEQEYGFKPDQVWLDKVRMASLRFGQGCSASFVSPKGLIMTNHHCVRGDIAGVQGADDWVRDGFVAASYDGEVKLPGLTVQQLVDMRDVSAEIDKGVEAGDDEATVADKRAQNEARVLADAASQFEDLTAQVVALFQGAQHQLYLYKIYDDVRLVMAPHLQTAHFGGDPDNFTYPRYGIDFSFCRAYDDGVPADTSANYFRWSEPGPQKGELVFVTGNPGSTSRLLTMAQFEKVRDADHAHFLEMLDHRIEVVSPFMAADPAVEKQLRTAVLQWQNGQKALGGELAGLRDPVFMAHKARAERAFRDRVMGDPELREKYGDVWDEIATVAAQQTALHGPLNFQTGGGSPHIEKALAVVDAVRAAVAGSEDAGDMARMAKNMPIRYSPIRRELVIDHFTRAARWLPQSDSYLRLVLGARSPREAEEWVTSSRISETDFVVEILAGGYDAVLESDDPAIQVARLLASKIEANQLAASELEARAGVLGTKIGLALFEAYGSDVSPDATFTLRLSDGVVKGYDYNGTVAPWRTTFYGMYARNVEFGDVYPFDLAAPWHERQGKIDLAKSVDFVCTVDSTGGNSGSPVINQKREIVGLLFDGNIESLSNEFIFDDGGGRSVCVHVHSIMEALTKVYDAHWVADELLKSGGE